MDFITNVSSTPDRIRNVRALLGIKVMAIKVMTCNSIYGATST